MQHFPFFVCRNFRFVPLSFPSVFIQEAPRHIIIMTNKCTTNYHFIRVMKSTHNCVLPILLVVTLFILFSTTIYNFSQNNEVEKEIFRNEEIQARISESLELIDKANEADIAKRISDMNSKENVFNKLLSILLKPFTNKCHHIARTGANNFLEGFFLELFLDALGNFCRSGRLENSLQ